MYTSRLSQVENSPEIDLGPLEVVAKGARRRVYRLDSQSEPIVLKLPDYAFEADTMKLPKRIRQKVLPRLKYRVISMEADYERRLRRKTRDRNTFVPLPAFKGYARTNRGVGALWQAVCADDGTLAPTLRDIAGRNDLLSFLPELNRFVASLFDLKVVAPDLSIRNVVLSGGVSPSFYLVDGFGDPTFIPVKSLISGLNKKLLHDRAARLARELNLEWLPGDRKFEPADC